MPADDIPRSTAFKNQLAGLLKKYPRSESDLEREFRWIAGHPDSGDRLIGFGERVLRKARLPLKAYQMGKSSGVRVTYAVTPAGPVILVMIHSKHGHGSEPDRLAELKEILRAEAALLEEHGA